MTEPSQSLCKCRPRRTTEHFVTPDCVECVMTWLLLGDGSVCLRCGCRLTWKGSK